MGSTAHDKKHTHTHTHTTATTTLKFEVGSRAGTGRKKGEGHCRVLPATQHAHTHTKAEIKEKAMRWITPHTSLCAYIITGGRFGSYPQTNMPREMRSALTFMQLQLSSHPFFRFCCSLSLSPDLCLCVSSSSPTHPPLVYSLLVRVQQLTFFSLSSNAHRCTVGYQRHHRYHHHPATCLFLQLARRDRERKQEKEGKTRVHIM
jgi:hypothetical protein